MCGRTGARGGLAHSGAIARIYSGTVRVEPPLRGRGVKGVHENWFSILDKEGCSDRFRGMASTADVASDMKGKNVLITGANSGIGEFFVSRTHSFGPGRIAAGNRSTRRAQMGMHTFSHGNPRPPCVVNGGVGFPTRSRLNFPPFGPVPQASRRLSRSRPEEHQ